MPDEQKAESTIVRPAPSTAEAIKRFVTSLTLANRLLAASEGPKADHGRSFFAGLELGLALATDNPGAAPLVLATIDASRRERHDAETTSQGNAARANTAKALADAAFGNEIVLDGQDITDQVNGEDEPQPKAPEFRWN